MINIFKAILWICWELFKLILLFICLYALMCVSSVIFLVPAFLLLIYTQWSAITMAIALAILSGFYFTLYKLYWKSVYTNARAYLIEQINKRKPNPETHCPNCGYDLRGLKYIRCPECGKFNPKFNPNKFLDQNQRHKKPNK